MVERINGRFAKGSTGNPAGRPKNAIADLQRTMREHAPLAIKTLVEVCTRAKKNSDRIRAGELILAYGFGRPSGQIDVSVMVKRLGEMSDIELAALESRLISAQAGPVIDLEPESIN